MKTFLLLFSLLLIPYQALPAAAAEIETVAERVDPVEVVRSLAGYLYGQGRIIHDKTATHVRQLWTYTWYADRGRSLASAPLEQVLAQARPSLYTFERDGRDFGFGFAYQQAGRVYIVGCRHHFLASHPGGDPRGSDSAGFRSLRGHNARRALGQVGACEVVSLDGRRFPASLAAVDESSALALVAVDPEVDLRPLNRSRRLSPLDGPEQGVMVIGKPKPVSPVVLTAETITFRLPGAPAFQPRLAVGSWLRRPDRPAPGPGCRPGPHLLSCCPDEIEYGSLEIGLGFGGGPVIDARGRLIGVHVAHGAYGVPVGFAAPITEADKLIIKTGLEEKTGPSLRAGLED